MKRLIKFGSLICGLGFLSSCGTLVNGTKQNVMINSDPSGAFITIDGKPAGKTPSVVKLKRNNSHQVCLDLPGYKPFDVEIERTFSCWTIGSFLGFGLIGVGVDAATGGMFNLDPKEICPMLQKE